jgi:hypothetical protein
MNWSDERYVRVYTRDTIGWFSLGWEAQALFVQILRKVDRAGILDLGIGALGIDTGRDAIADGCVGLAGLMRMPVEVVRRALVRLLRDGCIVHEGQYLIVKNFIEAQESTMSTVTRQRESRERRRDHLRAGLEPRIKRASSLVYFLQSEDGGPIKIGATNDVAKRIFELQTARADKLILLAAVSGDMMLERALHLHFASARVKGEWFSPVPELVKLINEATQSGSISIPSRETGTGESCDTSQIVTCHSVPDCTVPSCTDPEETHDDSGASAQETAASGSTPIVPGKPGVSVQDLEMAYRAYPRKEGKKAGLARARAQIRTPERLRQFQQAIENYARKIQYERTSFEYVKHFSTFVRCWEDYLDPSIAQPRRTIDPTHLTARDLLDMAAMRDAEEERDQSGIRPQFFLPDGRPSDGEDRRRDDGGVPPKVDPIRRTRLDGGN